MILCMRCRRPIPANCPDCEPRNNDSHEALRADRNRLRRWMRLLEREMSRYTAASGVFGAGQILPWRLKIRAALRGAEPPRKGGKRG
jgi:hypothetical protein